MTLRVCFSFFLFGNEEKRGQFLWIRKRFKRHSLKKQKGCGEKLNEVKWDDRKCELDFVYGIDHWFDVSFLFAPKALVSSFEVCRFLHEKVKAAPLQFTYSRFHSFTCPDMKFSR